MRGRLLPLGLDDELPVFLLGCRPAAYALPVRQGTPHSPGRL